MSTMLGLRTTTRSPKVGIGSRDLSSSVTTWVNVDSPRVNRDLARHNTLGQWVPVQPARFQLDTATVNGCAVTPRTASLTLDIAVGGLVYNWTDNVYTRNATATVGTALTQAVTPNATLPLVAAIGLNTSTPATPAAAIVAGTAAATELEAKILGSYSNATAGPAIASTADRTWLALVWVPPTFVTVTGVAATGVVTTPANHGYVAGDPVWFTTVPGASAGLLATTLYYVNTVPSLTTFTMSAVPFSGTTLTWTGNLTSTSVQRQILAKDVIDTRP